MSEDTAGSILEYQEDISDAEAPEPLPENTYSATIVSAALKDSKNNPGNQYVSVGVLISVDDYPADYPVENAPDGTRINNVYAAPYGQDRKSRFAMRQFCERTGAPMGASMDLNDWIGLPVKIELGIGTWEEVDRNEVKRFVRE